MLIVESAGLEIGSTVNATEPAWPNTFQSPCARCIAAAGLGQSIGSPAAMPLSAKSKGKATKNVISATTIFLIKHQNPGLIGPECHGPTTFTGIVSRPNGADIRTFECALVERDH
jgi:hypothetical protein